MVNLTAEQIERFKGNFKRGKGCWEWQGSIVKDRGGYGRFHANGKSHRAHRISWQIHKGEWPGDLFVCHKCDNPKCVRPSHLFLGTTTDNMRDMLRKRRKPSQAGERHPSNKLTAKDVKAIRKAHKKGVSQADLHRQYNVSRATICVIIKRVRWSHIKD